MGPESEIGSRSPGDRCLVRWASGRKTPDGLACAEPGYRVKTISLLLSVGLAVRAAAGLLYAMSERTSQLITIFLLVGALAMIGLVLSGTLQMSRLPVAQVATK
jgi:hypothetical protein